MKKIITLLLICLFVLSGCSSKPKDGIDRPSTAGQLKVSGTTLTDSKGNPVMLRGISYSEITTMERYITQETFNTLANDMRCNVVRIPLYTIGTGIVGYCTGGNKDVLKQDILNAVELTKKADMYILIDWHVLGDHDPNTYIEEAKEFFEYMSKELSKEKHVIYEICNEPNGVEWQDIKNYAETIIPIIRNNDPDSLIIVGTPEWSSDVDTAASDPLDYDNLMYSLHFYSATHKQDARDNAQRAIDKGLPIFVTEFGITSSNGDFPINIEEADIWIDFLEENNISYVNWHLSVAREASSALVSSTLNVSDFTEDQYTKSGKWLIETIKTQSEKRIEK